MPVPLHVLDQCSPAHDTPGFIYSVVDYRIDCYRDVSHAFEMAGNCYLPGLALPASAVHDMIRAALMEILQQAGKMEDKINVVFVCMGNICRSPSAEGVFRHLVEQRNLASRIVIDSAGTHAYHVGEAPDSRAQAAANRRGMDLSKQRARKFSIADFTRFDYIVAMDYDNLERLQTLRPPEFTGQLSLLLSYAPELGIEEVPDPYYGGESGFERVLDLIEQASLGLLNEISKRHDL